MITRLKWWRHVVDVARGTAAWPRVGEEPAVGLCEWREHHGVPYLYSSSALTDPSQAQAISDRQFELVMAQPAGSLVGCSSTSAAAWPAVGTVTSSSAAGPRARRPWATSGSGLRCSVSAGSWCR